MCLKIFGLSLCLLMATAGCAGKVPRGATPEAPIGQAPMAPSGDVVPLVGPFKVHRYTFENGLKLLVVEDHSSPTIAYQTWFKVGSRDEQLGKTGLAHLFEHMMFKQTKTLKDGEFDRILEEAGAEGENAFTSRDYTAYVQEMPKDKLELIIRLEADRMVNLVVDQKAFKTETEVVQNERRFRTENNPDGLMYQEIFGLAFTKHPYRWPIIGYQADLESMNSLDAEAFYKTFYSPNHATIIVTGDVSAPEVHALVKKYYGDLKAQFTPPLVIESEPPQTEPKRLNLKLAVQVEKLMMGYRIPATTDPDIAAIEVFQGVMTGGKSGRLQRALVETGIASGTDSYTIDDKDPSLFLIVANMQKGKKAAQAEAVIQRELLRIQKGGVGEKELEKVKNRLSFDFYESLNSNGEKARFLGHYEALAGNFEFGLRHHERIQAVKPADVLAVAKRYFLSNNRTVLTGSPK